jgi:hypothetical protein
MLVRLFAVMLKTQFVSRFLPDYATLAGTLSTDSDIGGHLFWGGKAKKAFEANREKLKRKTLEFSISSSWLTLVCSSPAPRIALTRNASIGAILFAPS